MKDKSDKMTRGGIIFLLVVTCLYILTFLVDAERALNALAFATRLLYQMLPVRRTTPTRMGNMPTNIDAVFFILEISRTFRGLAFCSDMFLPPYSRCAVMKFIQ